MTGEIAFNLFRHACRSFESLNDWVYDVHVHGDLPAISFELLDQIMSIILDPKHRDLSVP